MSAATTSSRPTAGGASGRPFEITVPEEALVELRRADRGGAVALQGAGRGPLPGRATRDDPGARPVLDDRVRLAPLRGEAERAAAVQDRDQRRGHPLHPREVTARGNPAIDPHPRLARLDRRDAGGDRPADRPNRQRRVRRGRLRPGGALHPGYGFSAEPTELGWSAGRVGQAWGKLMPRLGYTRYVA